MCCAHVTLSEAKKRLAGNTVQGTEATVDLTMEPPQLESNLQYCIKWGNYQATLVSTLPQLLDGDDLTDVTLSAGGRHLKAHRVVLSVCSDYFKQLFKGIDSLHHPVIVLPGIEYNDLHALVTFMYHGEVNIYQQQLRQLLAMAATLNIRGLTDYQTEPQDFSTTRLPASAHTSPASSHTSSTSRGKRQRLSSQTTSSSASDQAPLNTSLPLPEGGWFDTGVEEEAQDLSRKAPLSHSDPGHLRSSSSLDFLQNVCRNLSTSSLSTTVAGGAAETPGVADLSLSGPSTSSGSTSSASTSRASGRPSGVATKLFATCFVCGKQLSNQYNLRVHMETHQNAFYACSVCNHVSRSRDALRKHVSYRHPNTTP